MARCTWAPVRGRGTAFPPEFRASAGAGPFGRRDASDPGPCCRSHGVPQRTLSSRPASAQVPRGPGGEVLPLRSTAADTQVLSAAADYAEVATQPPLQQVTFPRSFSRWSRHAPTRVAGRRSRSPHELAISCSDPSPSPGLLHEAVGPLWWLESGGIETAKVEMKPFSPPRCYKPSEARRPPEREAR